MPQFSVVLIAKNEANTLPRLIKSLAEFQQRGGEIILVDTGSTDDTPKVASSLGCRVFDAHDRFVTTLDRKTVQGINCRFVRGVEPDIVSEGQCLFDYSAARNFASSLASNNVVSMPDCDETFTQLDIDTIDKAIEEGVGQFEYNFVFSHDEHGVEAIKFLHSKFYDRTKMTWTGIIHEILTGDCERRFFDENVIKLEHRQNAATDRSRYLPGLALDCYQHPKNDRNSHYFGRELLWNQRPMSAIAEFERHIAMNAWPAEASQSMIYIGDAYLQLNRIEDGLTAYHNAFIKDGTRREALIRLAFYYYRLNDAQHTAAYASAALALPWTPFYANNAADYRHTPHEMLYWALWQLNDREGAKEHWKKALAYQPKSEKYLADAQFFTESPVLEKSTTVLKKRTKRSRLLS